MRHFKLLDILCWALILTGAYLTLPSMTLSGDGGEYLMATHAIAKHQSVQILASDFADFHAKGQAALDKIGFPDAHFKELVERFHTPQPASWAGFASVKPDEIYSMHFWAYPLLAAPFYAAVTLAGQNPLLSLGLLNLAFAAIAVAYLRKAMGVGVHVGLFVFGLAGTIYYLNWTGPEVMTAACLLIASAAALRGDAGLGLFCAGLASTQNPPALFLMPFIVAAAAWIRWKKQEIWPGLGMARLGRSSIVLALAGALLAVLPYAFFMAKFGVPSLAGKYFTLPELISVQRFVSLFFDLDQGVLPAVPGLVTMWLACSVLLPREQRARFLVLSALAAAAIIVMSVPVLSAINWNSGGVVFARYGYWLMMPLAALLMIAASSMTLRRQLPILLAFVAAQLIPLCFYGLQGEQWSATRHTRLANFALYHFGDYYNPDPEIFYERGVGYEVNAPLAADLNFVLTSNGHPLKVLGNAAHPDANYGFCRDGEKLAGSRRVSMLRGWYYEHPPFRCEKLPHFVHAHTWPAGTDGSAQNSLFAAGWSWPEQAGRWTEGKASSLHIPIPQGARFARLHFIGHYFANIASTTVSAGGEAAQSFDLAAAPLTVNVAALQGKVLDIELAHPAPKTPLELGLSQDARKLAFFLERIELDLSE